MELTLNADDLKAFQDTIARAVASGIVSAVKVLARDGFLAPFAATMTATSEPAPAAAPPPAPVTPPDPAVADPPSIRVPVQRPSLDELVANAVRQRKETEAATETAKAPPAKRKQATDLYRQLLKVVESRPSGFIDTDSAVDIIGEDLAYSKQILKSWIVEGSIHALIVAGAKPPTKGLPGRLMVESRTVRERNQLRLQNRNAPPTERQRPTILRDFKELAEAM